MPIPSSVRTQTNDNAIYSVTFSPNGQVLAWGSLDNRIKLWESKTGKLIHILYGHGDGVASVAYSPDGATLVELAQLLENPAARAQVRGVVPCL